ncbi:hypothetical protein EDD15DRAFT_2528063 [Pisolithus albus]|nr:hypothetical protein EDD15DRAFT_2528063 [Pisolithus albus]
MAPQPILIAVMGPPQSGKTDLIDRLTGIKRETAALESYGQGVSEFTVNLPNHQQYVFARMPGFDDPFRSDWDILCIIAEWLEEKYRANVKLDGIIYTHGITDNLPSRSVCRNLKIFSRLCGRRAAGGVRLVTTMWGNVKNKEIAKNRVSQLETHLWKSLIDAGARHKRFKNSSRCAWEVIEDLTKGGEVLLLQEELVDEGRKLYETTAGQALCTQYQKFLFEKIERIKHRREEAKATKNWELMKTLEMEQDYREANLRKTWGEMYPQQGAFSSSITPFHDWAILYVVGPTGAGKTCFTQQLYKNHEGWQHPHTKNVDAWRCNFVDGSHNIIVVDTPSFHSYRNNLDTEIGIARWFGSNFTHDIRQSGILFLHSLDSDPMSGDMSMSWHLEMFAKAFPITSTAEPTVVAARNYDGRVEWNWTAFLACIYIPRSLQRATRNGLERSTNAAQEYYAGSDTVSSDHDWTPAKFRDSRFVLKKLAGILFEELKGKKRNRDLNAIIQIGQIALEHTPPEHSPRHSSLVDLADLLSERFNKKIGKDVVDESITSEQAVPPGEPHRQIILRESDDILPERWGPIEHLEKTISLRRAALERTPPMDRCGPLLELANALHEQFKRQGTESSITEAISLARTASSIYPPGHPEHWSSLCHLISYLETKVELKASLAQAKASLVLTRDLDSLTLSCPSSRVIEFIEKVIFERVKTLPPRLLHTPTGFLCGRDAQISHFKGSSQYAQLLSLGSLLEDQQLRIEIDDVISEYFEFSTLSHKWGRGEPLLGDIQNKSVYQLGGTDGEAKLQMFCIRTLQRSFQWAWSDTCCINKDSSAELQEAIGSMFSWYHWSSLTIVHLPDVFDGDSLAGSVWLTRGWTLQELLASHTVLFYTQNWSLYMDSDAMNHKRTPALLEELQNATGIAKQHLTNFAPGMDDARSRLHWASNRRTSRPEDIAYSLFGIFEVHLSIFYGESAHNAVGRLLAEIISRSGDVSVLDWGGETSAFNSCFPADLTPYQTVPNLQPIPSDLSRCDNLDSQKAQNLYSELARLPRAGFVNSKLTLPSTVHPVMAVKLRGSSIRPLRFAYEIHVARLRPLNVTLSVELDESVDTYILVRPWHPKSLEQQTCSVEAAWKLLELLEQPFNALLLKRSLHWHNEYTRIACDCTITARIQDLESTLDSEVLIPQIV